MYHRAKVVLIVGERGRSLVVRSLEISMPTNSDSNHVNNYRYYINDIYRTLIQQTNYTERISQTGGPKLSITANNITEKPTNQFLADSYDS